MPLDSLREELAGLARRVPRATIDLEQVLRSTQRGARRRRLTRASTVAVASIVCVAVGLGVIFSRSAGPGRLSVTRPTTPTAAPAPFTSEQLRAHDGVNLPSRWEPIHEGDA